MGMGRGGCYMQGHFVRPSVNVRPFSCVQGHGTFFCDNGDTYEGEWHNGRRHGKGRAVYGGRPIDGFGGDVYEGYFEDDVK